MAGHSEWEPSAPQHFVAVPTSKLDDSNFSFAGRVTRGDRVFLRLLRRGNLPSAREEPINFAELFSPLSHYR